ncbi:Undecaprenyl-diphosphatase BcrC [Pandoraea eparura]|jgi:membrane-associated phospholipid phosphatase|uniref:Undecaprenyl-diphosphatase BcrC n=1 Tax=Pandoraea eparura TaxID=2508291 RepID=A0A5E4UVK5_9BURK|nr:phosphatase PAP2 family protein [Pandoraea eparura]VVE03916.1 Undecaprenyl-diphosphatase BcrC [Pandoraea eparura]
MNEPASASAAPATALGLRNAWLSAFACLLLALVAIPWIDRPVVDLVHVHTQGTRWIQHVAELPSPLFALAWPTFGIVGAAFVWRRDLPAWAATLWLAAGAVGVGSVFKQGLKFAFGRTWPATWIHDNPSYLRDGVFQFRLFGGDGAAYASFPSGHLTVMLAFATVLALRHRALRWPCAVAIALTGFGQLAAAYHWTSDALAGAALGIAVGTTFVWAWQRWAIRRVVAV